MGNNERADLFLGQVVEDRGEIFESVENLLDELLLLHFFFPDINVIMFRCKGASKQKREEF